MNKEKEMNSDSAEAALTLRREEKMRSVSGALDSSELNTKEDVIKKAKELIEATSAKIETGTKEYLASCVLGCITEGEKGWQIDEEKLKSLLETTNGEGKSEGWGLSWSGRQKAVSLVTSETTDFFAEDRASSKNFDTTGNLYIEGDNLSALKLLQASYAGKVKMIYIDPPYNTGNDFVYADDFSDPNAPKKDLKEKFTQNQNTSNRYHSNWLTMMYPRLSLAKNLLSEDGVIFISIDDHEQANLKILCDEIFGERNFQGHIHWRRRHNQPNDKTKMIALVAEHIIVYAKDAIALKIAGVGKLDVTATFTNPDNDPNGPWASKPWKVGSDQSGSRYKITTPSGIVLDGEWMGEEATYLKLLEDGRIYFPKDGNGMPRKKYYQSERENEGQCATNWWPHDTFGHNQGANELMAELLGEKNVFSNPKPVKLLRALLKVGNVKPDDTILDFFSGSATTAHAVMALNAEDGGKRRFILVQLPEATDAKSEAAKAGYANICEIAKERIRRAGEKIKGESPLTTQELDIGFRVMKIVDDRTLANPCAYKTPEEWAAADVSAFDSEPIDLRTTKDEIFCHALRSSRLPFDLLLSEEEVGGVKVRVAKARDGVQVLLMAVVENFELRMPMNEGALRAFADGLDALVAKPKVLFVPQVLLPASSAAQQTFLERVKACGIVWKTV